MLDGDLAPILPGNYLRSPFGIFSAMQYGRIKDGDHNVIVDAVFIDKEFIEKGGLIDPMGKWNMVTKPHLICTLECPVSLKEADSTEGTYCSQRLS